MREHSGTSPRAARLAFLIAAGVFATTLQAQPRSTQPSYQFNDSHFHLTNYVQEGVDIHDFLKIMGNDVGRVALFGIPLQQTWSHENSGDYAPTYYLQSDAPLYYYSFTDAYIAYVYKSLTPAEQKRFEPMITGFNPADMYAVDHIKRVLKMYPGVFTGIGEFTIHKEFVSSKVAGETASLTNPALDRIFDFCAESGLLVLIHSDIDMPFAKENAEPVYLSQMKALLRRHPNTTVIWAHTGLGRVVHPVQSSPSVAAAERPPNHLEIVTAMLDDPTLAHLNFDISWDEVAKYVVSTPDTIRRSADALNRHADRFLFGTDEVAPRDRDQYFKVFRMYEPLWAQLTPDARAKVTQGNFVRLFDAASKKVRAWEAKNLTAR
ncbi:MAG TPA: amidohydrolase family protein [Gammaproteobacteria bacterium]|nr:amidohydrolase family protein [Gammaproteobacteria bacterium]